MAHPAWLRVRVWVGTALALVWWPGGLFYIVYSATTATGPGGWLMDWQMRLFGSGSTKGTVFALFCAWMFLGLVAQHVWDSLTERFWPESPVQARLRRRAEDAVRPRWR